MSSNYNQGQSLSPWREKLNEVIFSSETAAGRNFDVAVMKTIKQSTINNEACPDCGAIGHDIDAQFCKYCGHNLENIHHSH